MSQIVSVAEPFRQPDRFLLRTSTCGRGNRGSGRPAKDRKKVTTRDMLPDRVDDRGCAHAGPPFSNCSRGPTFSHDAGAPPPAQRLKAVARARSAARLRRASLRQATRRPRAGRGRFLTAGGAYLSHGAWISTAAQTLGAGARSRSPRKYRQLYGPKANVKRTSLQSLTTS